MNRRRWRYMKSSSMWMVVFRLYFNLLSETIAVNKRLLDSGKPREQKAFI